MSLAEMEDGFALAVRHELSAIGSAGSRLQRHRRRGRALALGVGVVAAAVATTGAAVLAGAFPGTTTVGPLGNIVTVTHTGTGTIDLGPAPVNAAVVSLDLTCASDSGGQVSLLTRPQEGAPGPDGAGTFCPNRMHIEDALLPPAGSTSITITADDDTTWTASAQYASSAVSDWAVNENGQTVGVPNDTGTPELQPAYASNGRQGYVLTDDFALLDVDHPIDIYEFDGTTAIGQMEVERAPEVPVDLDRIPLSPVDPGSDE